MMRAEIHTLLMAVFLFFSVPFSGFVWVPNLLVRLPRNIFVLSSVKELLSFSFADCPHVQCLDHWNTWHLASCLLRTFMLTRCGSWTVDQPQSIILDICEFIDRFFSSFVPAVATSLLWTTVASRVLHRIARPLLPLSASLDVYLAFEKC